MPDKIEAIRRSRELYDGLNHLVLAWDPYGLSQAGEVADEFSPEVWDLLGELCEVETEEQAIQAVSRVFSRWFDPYDFSHVACREFGVRTFHWWLMQK